MAKYNLSVRYKGEGVSEGRIPVADLAPSLMGLSASLQSIQKEVFPESDPISLDITATAKGSFIVDLLMANGADAFKQAVDILSGQPGQAVVNLGAIVGMLITVIKVTPQLHHKKIEKKEYSGTDVILHLEDSTTITITKNALTAYQSLEVRKGVDSFVSPLEKGGINEIEFSDQNDEKIIIDDSQVDAFKTPKIEDKELETNTSVVYLQIINVAFEHGKWKFSNGSNQFFAEIKDQAFLDSVEKNQEQFGSTDTLKVELETKQTLTSQGLKSDFTILRVLEHVRGAQQIELDFAKDNSKE